MTLFNKLFELWNDAEKADTQKTGK